MKLDLKLILHFIVSSVIIFANITTYYLLTNLSETQLLSTPEISGSSLNLLKFFFSPLLHLSAAFFYFYLAGRQTVYQIIQKTLIATTLIFSLYTFVLLPNIAFFESSEFVAGTSPLGTIFHFWVTSSLYLLISLWPTITILLFYGYNNEILTFKQGVQLYPAFGVIALVISRFVIPSTLSVIKTLASEQPSLSLGIIILLALIITQLSFSVLHKNEGEPKTETSSKLGLNYILGIGFIVLTIGLIKNISLLTWNFSCRIQQPWDQNYWKYLKGGAGLDSLGTLLSVIILVFLGLYLRQNLAKGWKNFCRGGTITTLIIGVLIITIQILGGFFESFLTTSRLEYTYNAVTNVGAAYQILITSILVPSLTCLKELAILPIPKKHRFRAKSFIDLVFWKLGYFLVVLIQEALIKFIAIPTPIMIFITLAFLLILFTRLAVIRYVGTRLEEAVAS